MDDLLKNLIAGDDDEELELRGLGSLSGLLGSLMGGAAPAAPPQTGTSQGLGDLLGMMGEGGEQPEQPAPQTGGGLGDLLGMLGGAGAQPQQPAPQTGGGLGDLMGMLGGAGAAQPAQSGNLLGGLLGGVLGGGSQTGITASSNPLVGGIASVRSQKLGISESVAGMIVGAAITLLLQSLQKRAVARQAPGEGIALPAEAMEAPELGDVLKTLGGSGTSASRLATNRATAQIAEQAGIDQETAEQGLQEAFRLLSGQFGG